MNNLDKVLAVAQREYLATVKTRAFVVALFLMPVLMIAAMSVPLIFEHQASKADKRCAVVDHTGQLYSYLVEQAREREDSDQGRYQFELVEPGGTERTLELAQRVRDEELFAFVEIDADVLDVADGATAGQVRYYSNTPTHMALKRWIESALQQEIFRLRLQRAGIDPKQVANARTEIQITEEGLPEASESGIVKPNAPDPINDIGIPIGAALLMFSSVMLGVGPLMQSALEEKMQRIAEVLVSSVPPFQLLLGKLLGASAVSYTLLALYGGGAIGLAAQFQLPAIWQPQLWLALVVFQAIALLMYGSVFLAVGSACSDLKESQTLMMPVMIVVTSPMLLLQLILVDPNGPASVAASLFPPFTPLLLMLRAVLPPGAPLWQVLFGVALGFAAAISCLWAASRVFRVGMLMQGSAPSYRTLLRWIRSG